MKCHVLVVALTSAMLLAGSAQAQITVTKARIGCLDIQTEPNLTALVAAACGGRWSCQYQAPTPAQYTAAGVRAATRLFCTQAMEIVYHCGRNDFHTVQVPGDAWDQPPAQLTCSPPTAPPPATPRPDQIHVTMARIGCLDIQRTGNLTRLVSAECNGRSTCVYPAPTPEEYARAGVHAATRTFCTQAMEITYDCGRNDPRTVFVPGDAWKRDAAQLTCAGPPPPPRHDFGPGEGPISVTAARIGCLDVQREANLARLVAASCNGRPSCSYKAPTPDAYRREGVVAATRDLCTQAMEITYRCGTNDDQSVLVPGDAWNQPPAALVCNGDTLATNRQDVTPATPGTPGAEPACEQPRLAPPNYYLAPRDMLDWSRTSESEIDTVRKHMLVHGDLFQLASVFVPGPQPTRGSYSSSPRSSTDPAPGSTLGSNEGRVRADLRALAKRKDPLSALCQAAQMFTRNRPADAGTPSDRELGTAFADLSVTGKVAFAAFVRERPDEARLRAHTECAGASNAALTAALRRAYDVAAVLRGDYFSEERQALGWIAVSGEDDQPYRPVNVPPTRFPQFQVKVDVPGFGIPVNTRYMIAHRRSPRFSFPSAALVDGGPGRRVPADPLPALAPDAEVILFIHGMDSRLEEADGLTRALHGLPGRRNWTVISVDLPTSGYADNIHHGRISPVTEVACHNTPLLDFIERFIVSFVDTVDAQVGGQLKPAIKAVVGGSLGGNMSMRLGRRPATPWVRNVVPWSPAAIWPSKIAQRNAVAAGCDTGWNMLDDRGVDVSLTWSGKDPFFLPENELSGMRRTLFYGGFDWAPVGGLGGPAQAQCWFSDKWTCKQQTIRAARLDRQETYDANFRAWHWRLAAEQLAFSQQQFAPGTTQPLYLRNQKRMLLICGYDDTCANLCQHTRDVASRMVDTPGYARFMKQTGHSVDTEYPVYIARQLAEFLR